MNRKYIEKYKVLFIICLDILSIIACEGLSYLIRFDFSFSAIPPDFKSAWMDFIPVEVLITVGIFYWRKMYHYVWRSISALDLTEIAVSILMSFFAVRCAGYVLGYHPPFSVIVISLLLKLFCLAGLRCALRFYHSILNLLRPRFVYHSERIMLIGGGSASQALIREAHRREDFHGNICCIIDDSPAKQGRYLEGVKVVGGREHILAAAKEYNVTQIIFSIPSASASVKKELLELCQKTGCRVRSVPGLYQLINGEVSLSSVEDIQMEDLLGRDPIVLDKTSVTTFIRNQVVLVTGGGGSIGSELCRQIARFAPKRIVVLDVYENNAYDLQQELQHIYGQELDLRVEIASVRDKQKIVQLFQKYQPDIVFHAAAHKHVPLMEACPDEAIKNNVFGTYHVIRAAEKTGVKKFVMISTDKAVNPTNFMGATKRLCEMILQSRKESSTEFCAVRFGNVLGSNGSVVPLFQKQIAAGGPVTITDKRIIRYFMTIPEAAQLVLEAGAMAKENQIFVLDMGEPVKILTLAENLIRLSGLEPYKDIAIEEIGLRPGEKLYEELLIHRETMTKTSNNKIFIEHCAPVSKASIDRILVDLDHAVTADLSPDALITKMHTIVSSYHDPSEVNSSFPEPSVSAS